MQRNGVKREETALVTGASGYVAGWMIVGLLREGYAVRATLRNLSRQNEVRAAVAAKGVSVEDLTFAEADLLRDEGWHAALAGCTYALHVASPMGQGAPKGTDLVTPAREGTLRVLRAAAANGVQRVVCTSSVAAAQATAASDGTEPRADETTWTDLRGRGVGEYIRSKTLAERAAWEFIEKDASGLTLATVLPGMILGPAMTGNISGSVGVVARLLTGKTPALPYIGFSISDISDLVKLHLKAMVSPAAANQRLIGVGDFLWLSEMAEILRERFPEWSSKIPRRRLPDWLLRLLAPFQEEAKFAVSMLGRRREYNAGKASALLGWQARPSRDALLDCAKSLIDSQLV